MNEITIHGNLTADPVLREGQSGKPFLTCTVAVNRSYYAAERGTRVDLPAVFHSVIAFNQLADNAAQTLAKGMTVTVTGYLAVVKSPAEAGTACTEGPTGYGYLESGQLINDTFYLFNRGSYKFIPTLVFGQCILVVFFNPVLFY